MNADVRKAVAGACGAVAGYLVVRQVRKSVRGVPGILLGMVGGSIATFLVRTVVDGVLAKNEPGPAEASTMAD